MEPQLTILLLVPWLLLVPALPIVAFLMGRRTAREREQLEAPHRHPRPAADVEEDKLARDVDEDLTHAFASGLAAAGSQSVTRDRIPALLSDRYGLRPAVASRGDAVVVRVEREIVPTPCGCAYDRGILAGLYAAADGQVADVAEETCVRDGAPQCSFRVTPVKTANPPVAPRTLVPSDTLRRLALRARIDRPAG